METAGLAVGALSLAGLFNNAVQCFEFVQLGRSFGKDFETSQLKLECARLRLSRWGAALGLGEDLQNEMLLEARLGSQVTEQAKQLLGQTLAVFEEAKGVSSKYVSQAKLSDGQIAVCNSQENMDPPTADLCNHMRQISLKRQNRTSILKKTKWALYQEKHFRRLIEDIKELIDGLIGLFPASQEDQQRLCSAEVSTMGDSAAMPLLSKVASEQDALLTGVISKLAASKGASYSTVFSGDHNSGVQVGQNMGSMREFTFGRGNQEGRDA
ncbi:MAG: hypothetical protein OHK93_002456 [Ramalina farinacea]|uniref:Prion-inhibition and propagation HeLo domain-containing protein n=1 Tax=Ramalina farinacea TaxID=258253 RepID=A0AA43QRE7_9LECA|nr:hypothetical protein [Ramalina farinacea]